MKKKISISFIIVLFVVFLISTLSAQAELRWTDTSYEAYSEVAGGGYQPANQSLGTWSSLQPVEASVCSGYYYFIDGPPSAGRCASATITNTNIVLSSTSLWADPLFVGTVSYEVYGRFSGSFISSSPFLQFSYDYNPVAITESGVFSIGLIDTNTLDSIYDYGQNLSTPLTGSNILSIPVPVGRSIRLDLYTSLSGDDATYNSLQLNYSMASSDNPVAPEPISSILFVTGGTLLAGRSYLRRKKKA